MKNWSICNISEGMESEVKLSSDDIVDSFLNENGIYAGNPLVEFIDIKRLRRSLLKEMDADIPRAVDRPAIVKTAEARFLGIDQNTELDKHGRATFTFQIEVPAFATPEQKFNVISKVRTEISKAQQVACKRVCQLYYTTPEKAYSNVMSQFKIGFANENDEFIAVPKDAKGNLDLTGIESGKLLTCRLIFTPTLPAFQNRFLQIRAQNYQVSQAHKNIDAAEAEAAAEAKPQAAVPAKPQGPSVSPTGMPTYGPRGNQ